MNIYNLTSLCYIPIFSGLLFLFLSCNQASEFSQAPLLLDNQQKQKSDKTGAAKKVFKSTDGGQTWQDISKGLPENLRIDSIRGRGDSIFANDEGLFLRVGNGLYHNTPNATAPFWTAAFFPDSQPRYFGEHNSIAPGKSGIFAYNHWGVNLKKTNGTSVWSPIFDNFSEPRIRSVFETAGGTVFIGTDRGLFKTANCGKTWKHVYAGGWAGNFAESNGVLVSTSIRRIIRSTDNGENWVLVGEGGVTWDVKQIKGGFAAITSSSASGTRRLRTSYDGGKTWQPIDAGLRDKVLLIHYGGPGMIALVCKPSRLQLSRLVKTSFVFIVTAFFRSSDKGKTWKLLLPSIEDKVFNLFGSGNVIYAIPSKGGC